MNYYSLCFLGPPARVNLSIQIQLSLIITVFNCKTGNFEFVLDRKYRSLIGE